MNKEDMISAAVSLKGASIIPKCENHMLFSSQVGEWITSSCNNCGFHAEFHETALEEEKKDEL